MHKRYYVNMLQPPLRLSKTAVAVATTPFSPQIYTLFIKNTNFSWQCTRCLTQIEQIDADFYVKLRQLEQLKQQRDSMKKVL